jgi:hypothetical protein
MLKKCGSGLQYKSPPLPFIILHETETVGTVSEKAIGLRLYERFVACHDMLKIKVRAR